MNILKFFSLFLLVIGAFGKSISTFLYWNFYISDRNMSVIISIAEIFLPVLRQ